MKNIPQDINAEVALLGSMMLDKEVFSDSKVKSDDFYKPVNQEIFKTMVKLDMDSKTIDGITLSESMDQFDFEMYNDYTTQGIITSNSKHYEEIVIKKSISRKYIQILDNALNSAYNGGDPQAELSHLDDVESVLEDELTLISDGLTEAYEHIEYLQNKKGYEGIETKIKLLDYMHDGLKKQTLNIWAARPAMGKTALALQIANSAAKQNKKVAIFSLEMGKRELIKRLIVSESQVNLNVIKNKQVDDGQRKRITNACGNLHRRNIFISDKFSQTATDIYKSSRRLKKRNGLDLIIIDYLQLMKPDGKFNNKNDEIGHNSRMLKKLAKDLDIPVICLSQLSRTCESRDNKRPIMSDLRDSGSIEQDADIVMFLYRDDVYKKDEDSHDYIAELITRKNRAGETGTVKTIWNGGIQKFDNI